MAVAHSIHCFIFHIMFDWYTIRNFGQVILKLDNAEMFFCFVISKA